MVRACLPVGVGDAFVMEDDPETKWGVIYGGTASYAPISGGSRAIDQDTGG